MLLEMLWAKALLSVMDCIPQILQKKNPENGSGYVFLLLHHLAIVEDHYWMIKAM